MWEEAGAFKNACMERTQNLHTETLTRPVIQLWIFLLCGNSAHHSCTLTA